MLEEIKQKTAKHLINLIKQRSGGIPSFSLLLGAGASVSSGVKLSREIVEELRLQLFRNLNTDLQYEEWLKEQYWYNYEKEYSILFEKVYDERAQRRIYIEKCVEGAHPSWGYIYLSNIIANNFFNVVFSTNFDDLLNEACFIYSNCRPIVCAHDSSVKDIRITSKRPKIIKLHGDFLYDDIKNTFKETDTLEDNMKEKFIQFGKEYGLVVIGYGGNDHSIMDVLNMMIKSKNYFPCGIYWCTKNIDKVNKNVIRLLQNEGVYLVKIDGFDEFMAELHDGLHIELQDTIKDPYRSITTRLNNFIDPIHIPKRLEHPIIKKDANILGEQINMFEQVVSNKNIEEFDRFVPYDYLASRAFTEFNDYEKAIEYYNKALIQNELNETALRRLGISFMAMNNMEKGKTIIDDILKKNPRSTEGLFGLMSYNMLNGYIEKGKENAILLYEKDDAEIPREFMYTWLSSIYNGNGEWKLGLDMAEKGLQIDENDETHLINKASSLKNLGNEDESKQIINKLIDYIEKPYNKACAYAIINKKEEMLLYLEESIKEDILNVFYMRFEPDFINYLDDEDIIKLKEKYLK